MSVQPTPQDIELILADTTSARYRDLRDRAAYLYLTGSLPSHLRPLATRRLALVSTMGGPPERQPAAPGWPAPAVKPSRETARMTPARPVVWLADFRVGRDRLMARSPLIEQAQIASAAADQARTPQRVRSPFRGALSSASDYKLWRYVLRRYDGAWKVRQLARTFSAHANSAP